MDAKLRNRVTYWALAIIPFAGVVLAARFFDSLFFFLFLLFYFFLYRPLLDMRRLLSLHMIEEKDGWRFFVPFAVDRTRYFKALWWG